MSPSHDDLTEIIFIAKYNIIKPQIRANINLIIIARLSIRIAVAFKFLLLKKIQRNE
jgi:hypothetical protein